MGKRWKKHWQICLCWGQYLQHGVHLCLRWTNSRRLWQHVTALSDFHRSVGGLNAEKTWWAPLWIERVWKKNRSTERLVCWYLLSGRLHSNMWYFPFSLKLFAGHEAIWPGIVDSADVWLLWSVTLRAALPRIKLIRSSLIRSDQLYSGQFFGILPFFGPSETPAATDAPVQSYEEELWGTGEQSICTTLHVCSIAGDRCLPWRLSCVDGESCWRYWSAYASSFRRLCLEFSIACATDECLVRCLPLSIGLLCLIFVVFIFGVSF